MCQREQKTSHPKPNGAVMFKKRSVKGQKRAITRDIPDEVADSERETIVKRQRTISNSVESTGDGHQIKQNGTPLALTRNEEATKVDILNDESMDHYRTKKLRSLDPCQVPDMEDDVYKGKSNYAKFIKPKSDMDEKGPKKTASNVRSTTTFDFQRDVCKDYKQTGFCGYGDSCKFLHARDDFKAGWKLNNDWDLESKKNQDKLETELKDVPFKCVICKGDYKSPVQTKCGHFFCELCFLNRNKKSKNCAICGKNTDGIVLPAKNLKEILKKSNS